MRKLLSAVCALALLAPAIAQQINGGGGGGGSGSGTLTSVVATCGIAASPSPITTTGTITGSLSPRNNTGTTDTLTNADCGNVVTESNAAPVAVSITTASFASGNYVAIKNLGTTVVTYTPTSGTIAGSATYTLSAGQFADIYFDGTNWQTLDTGVGTIASGTAVLGTTSISSATCASAVVVAATPIATTDSIIASFNADPSASTGYLPSTSGGLIIYVYPTANNANFKVCNNTSGSITPSPITLNWRVVR